MPRAPAYMVLYGSLMILLLTFFIVLVNLSSFNGGEKLERGVNSIREVFGIVQKGKPGVLPGQEKVIKLGIPSPRFLPAQKETKEMLTSSVKQFIREAKAKGLQDIKATYLKKGVALTLPEAILFALGRAELKPEALKILDKIITLVKDRTYDIRVEGYTDNLSIHTREFPSNWELSAARAISVIRNFHRVGNIDYKRLSAIGYGEYRPVATNKTREGRQENRRVEIIIREGGKGNG